MRINHRLAGLRENPFWREVDRLGLDYERGDDNILNIVFNVMNITEDHPLWPSVEGLWAKYEGGPHLFNNIFSREELDAALWLELSAKGHHGYPMPDDDFGYLEATYDTTDLCPICGIGAVQKAPFRLRAEPKAAHSQFVQLNWVFDEFFVRLAAADELVRSGLAGIDFLAPVLHRRGQPSSSVVQMRVTTVLPPALDSGGLQPVTCRPHNEEWRPGLPPGDAEREGRPYCGRVKYHRGHKGPFRFDRRVFDGAPDVVKSHEWFGSGAAADRLVIVSQRFRQLVTEMRWRGLDFEPIELVATVPALSPPR